MVLQKICFWVWMLRTFLKFREPPCPEMVQPQFFLESQVKTRTELFVLVWVLFWCYYLNGPLKYKKWNKY